MAFCCKNLASIETQMFSLVSNSSSNITLSNVFTVNYFQISLKTARFFALHITAAKSFPKIFKHKLSCLNT